MPAALLRLIAAQSYPDPSMQPLSQRNDLWRVALHLADLCPGMKVVSIQAQGTGLEPLDEAQILPPASPVGSDQCFLDAHALVWQGWALNHLGVFPEAQLSVRALEHMRAAIAKDGLRCLAASALVKPDELPDLPSMDEEEALWLDQIRSHAQASVLEQQATHPSSYRNGPRL